MSEHRVITAVVHHGDGSVSSRGWVVSPQRQDDVAALLGEPTYTTHLPAAAVARLTPQVHTAALTVMAPPDQPS